MIPYRPYRSQSYGQSCQVYVPSHRHLHMHCTCTCITHDEQVGTQIEEPFSILPLEAFCNSAIAAISEEMLGAVHSGVFEHDDE